MYLPARPPKWTSSLRRAQGRWAALLACLADAQACTVTQSVSISRRGVDSRDQSCYRVLHNPVLFGPAGTSDRGITTRTDSVSVTSVYGMLRLFCGRECTRWTEYHCIRPCFRYVQRVHAHHFIPASKVLVPMQSLLINDPDTTNALVSARSEGRCKFMKTSTHVIHAADRVSIWLQSAAAIDTSLRRAK